MPYKTIAVALLATALLPAAVEAAPAGPTAAPQPTYHPLQRRMDKNADGPLRPTMRAPEQPPLATVQVVAHVLPDGTLELNCDGGHPAHPDTARTAAEAQR